MPYLSMGDSGFLPAEVGLNIDFRFGSKLNNSRRRGAINMVYGGETSILLFHS